MKKIGQGTAAGKIAIYRVPQNKAQSLVMEIEALI